MGHNPEEMQMEFALHTFGSAKILEVIDGYFENYAARNEQNWQF